MATNTKFVQMKTARLKVAISDSSTTAIFTNFLDLNDVPVVQTDFGAVGYGTLEPNTPREEAVSFIVDSNTDGEATLTLVRGLLGKHPYGTGGASFAHQAQTELVISNNPDLMQHFAAKNNDETITGTWTFATAPTALSATDASTTVKGNVKLSSAPATDLGTFTVTIATPGVFTNASHGLTEGDSVELSTTGALPTGLATSTKYFVIATGLTTNNFQLSATVGGSAIATSGTQSGVHTLTRTTPVAVGNDDSRVPTADEKAAMAGVDELGTPSNTNKFLTENARAKVVEFLSSGTWTKDAGLQRIRVQAWGAGGSGGVGQAGYGGGGGGGGGYIEQWFEADDLGATETVTIGAGGAAKTGINTRGSVGGNTTFGSLITAYGGGGGGEAEEGGGGGGGTLGAGASSVDTPGGAGGGPDGGGSASSSSFGGGGGSDGDVGAASGGGSSHYGGGGGGGSSQGSSTISGPGGSSYFGGGGGGGGFDNSSGNTAGGTSVFGGAGGVGATTTNNAGDGAVPGGGGGGSETGNSGAGGDGKVIVTEYYI